MYSIGVDKRLLYEIKESDNAAHKLIELYDIDKTAVENMKIMVVDDPERYGEFRDNIYNSPKNGDIRSFTTVENVNIGGSLTNMYVVPEVYKENNVGNSFSNTPLSYRLYGTFGGYSSLYYNLYIASSNVSFSL